MTRRANVLLCDDDPLIAQTVRAAVGRAHELTTAKNTDEALAVLRRRRFDLLFLDIEMRTPDEGLERLPELRALDPAMTVVMVSGRSEFPTIRRAMRAGANDYIPKDFQPDELLLAIELGLERKRLADRAERGERECRSAHERHVMVGKSPAIDQLRRTIEKLRKSRANVLIQGETGCGKEVVARQIRATREDGSLEPFVAVDSATIQSATAESQLFGHEKGAFTGADRARTGLFEEADGGIVYFDEVGNMPVEIQGKLLRVLQEKEVTRMGSSASIPLEFRVVAATNRDLEAMARVGSFKDDLLQRLAVIPVVVPPLRERREDIPLLVEHFCSGAAVGRKIAFSAEAMGALGRYDWPGNIRELSNAVAYVATLADGDICEIADLPPKFRGIASPGRSFYDQVAAFEAGLLRKEIEACDGNISKLALRLDMDRSHLYSKLKEHGIEKRSREK